MRVRHHDGKAALAGVPLDRRAAQPGGVIVRRAMQQPEHGVFLPGRGGVHADLTLRGLRKHHADGDGHAQRFAEAFNL